MSNAPSNMVDPPTPGNADNVGKAEPSIPEKYQGKSQQELIQMIEDGQKQVGRQSNEIGELRRLAEQAAQPPQQEPEIDWFSDPEAAFKASVSPMEQRLQAAELRAAKAELKLTHPDFEKVTSSTEFETWVLESKARTNQFVNANSGDLDAAVDLLNTYKQVTGANKEAAKETKKAVKRDRELRAATSERGAGTLPSGQTVKAADLRELRQKNPERYRALNPAELYAKGLVTRD